MGSTVNIVEIIDGKYRLNKELLRSVISLAEDCDRIALISIIGHKYSGKSFLINCLLSYLESNQRDVWPQNTFLELKYGFQNNYNDMNPKVQLWSKPFIIEDENQRIAIFLMDSNHVFTDICELSKTQQMKDIIGLFMLTSSTVIYTKRFKLMSQTLPKFQECLAKNLEFIQCMDSFQELFFYIQDWDPKFAESNHLFGSKGGKEYINKESEGLEFKNFFENIECYLMPSPGLHINKLDLRFSLLTDQFIFQLSQMVKMKLLNVDEMQIKSKPKTSQPIKANELIELFESYINKLNADSNDNVSQHLMNSFSNLKLSSSEMKSTAIIKYQKISTVEINLEERRSDLEQFVNSQLNIGQEVLQIADECYPNQKVFGDNHNNSNLNSCGNYSFGVQSVTSINTIPIEINESEVNQNLNESDLNDETQNDVEMSDMSTDTNDIEMLDSVMDEFDEHRNQNEKSTLTDDRLQEKISQNKSKVQGITNDQIFKFCECLLTEYRTVVEKASMTPEFDFENGLSITHNNEEKRCMSSFINKFNDKISPDLYNDFKNQLSDKMNIIKDNIKEVIGEQFNELRNEYEIALKKSIELYDNEMRGSIDRHLKSSNHNIDLFKIDNQSNKISIQSLESEANFIHLNIKLFKEFSNKLRNELNVKKSKYETALGLIKSYRNDWDSNYNKYRFISSDRMQDIQKNLCENIILSLDKLNDQYLKVIIKNSLQNIFVSIQKRNEDINNRELALAEEVINFIFDLFCKRLNYKLKSGLFSSNVMKEIHKILFEYTLKTMITDCDFKEYQKHLIKICKNGLKEKVEQNEAKIYSEYLKRSANATNVLKKAQNEALHKYCSEMERKLSEKPYYKRNEFENISSLLRNDSLKVNEKLVESLRRDFNSDFYDSLVLENIRNINSNINIHEDLFMKLIEKNAPKVTSIAIYFGRHSLSSAHYENETKFILDKNENKLRPNSIAFSDEIQFGSEAKAYYENFQSDKDLFDKNFDLKQLIRRNRNDIKNAELRSYPFEFLTDKLRVKVNNNLIKNHLSIESLIALQVLDIKLDAEKQLGTNVTNAVLTVPTYYDLRQRNAFKDVAKIVGFEEVIILSEMSATAVSYATDMNRVNRHLMSSVFFVIVNELECDTAIICIKDTDIHYKSYFHKNLSLDNESGFFNRCYKDGKKFISSIINSFINNSEKHEKEKFMKTLNSLFDKTIYWASNEQKYIDDIVIAGHSSLMDIIKQCIALYFNSNSFYCCEPIDIITNGSAVFSQTIGSNKSKTIHIQEVSLYPYYYSVSGKRISEHKTLLLPKNKLLPYMCTEKFYPPNISNLPLKISVFQDQIRVLFQSITSLPPQNFQELWHFHKINFRINEFGETTIISKLTTEKSIIEPKLDLIEYKLGLTESEIIEEQNIIFSIEIHIKNKQKLIEENSAINRAKRDLENYYLEVKKSVENNSNLRGLKLKKINKELEKTIKLLQSNDNEVKAFDNQKLQLQQIFAIL